MSPPIAIVGMACRFPGAGDVQAFADLTRAGHSVLAPVPQARWDLGAGNDPDRVGLPQLFAGLVPDIDQLDRKLMRVSANEAPLIDPMHRLFFESAWGALEDAGLSPAMLEDQPIGVFAGASNSEFALLQAMSGFPMAGSPYQNTGSSNSVIAGRVSYTLGLTGPVQVVDNACASSHTAVTAACDSLVAGDCDLALAGGVHVMLSADVMSSLHATGVISKDGVMRCFDARAGGYVRGEGCGVVALRPLDQAMARGDRIHAVIRGWHLRHNGRTNGMTAPSRAAQAGSITAAVADSGLEPGQITYAEAHGTATRLGDLMEGAALHQVLDAGRKLPLAVGTVKAQIGHLEAAAGSAGLIKTALALRDGIVPPLLGHDSFPPDLTPPRATLRIPAQAEPWPEDAVTDRAAIVASLGYNGACSHIVMTGSDASAPKAVQGPGLFLISAACGDSLRARMAQLADLLRANPDTSVAALAQAVSSRWDGLTHRVALVADSTAAVLAQVHDWLATADPASCRTRPGQGVTVQGDGLPPGLFPHQGAARLSLILSDTAGAEDAKTVHAHTDDPWPGVARIWALGGRLETARIWSGVAHLDLPPYPFQRSPAWALPKDTSS